MTYIEKKALLAAKPNEKMMWNILVVVLGLNLVYALYSIVTYFISNSETVSAGGMFGSFVLVAFFIAFALSAWIAWGIYRLERWVTMWLWINLVFSLLSFNFIGLVISIAVLVIYSKILNAVYPKKSVTPGLPA